MTTTPELWLDKFVNEGVVDPPGRTNAKARDSLLAAARTSLADATRDPERSPGGIIRDRERRPAGNLGTCCPLRDTHRRAE
jgi:hypothetical protein